MRDVSQKFLFRNHIIFYANNTTQSIQLAEYPILPLFIPLLHCHVYVRPVGTTSDSIESTDKTLTQLNSNKPPYIAWKKEDKLLEKKIFCPHMEIYGIQLCRYLFVFSTILEHCARSSKFSLLIQYKMMIMKRNQYNKNWQFNEITNISYSYQTNGHFYFWWLPIAALTISGTDERKTNNFSAFYTHNRSGDQIQLNSKQQK